MNSNDDIVAEQDSVQQDGHQIVTFYLNEQRFAVPMSAVQEIVRLPATVKVPLSSSHLCGLANLRGRVLPVFQCRTMMGMLPREADESSRVLVLSLQSPVGIVVDRVHAVMSVNESELEALDQQEHIEYSEWLSAVVRHQDGLILILDTVKLMQAHASAANTAQHAHATSASLGSQHAGAEADDVDTDELQLVSFEVQGQEYAAPIARVQEILQVPSVVTSIPNAPHGVLGVMELRSRLLPLVSLRSIFSLPEQALEESHRVVVLQTSPRHSVGVVMDRVNEVIRVPRQVVEEVPSLFSTGGQVRHLSGICRLEQGKRLVSVLDVDSLLGHAEVCLGDSAANVADTNQSDEGNLDMSDDSNPDDNQVVVFILGDEEFGVNIHSVQEIVRVPERLTTIPQAPESLEGIINLRGTVLPVIDQRRRMGIASGERTDRQRIMVYLVGGVRTGFIVDAVTEVLRLESRFIADTPADGLHSAELLPKVANLLDSKRMILLIDPQALMNGPERQWLKSQSGFAGAQPSVQAMDSTPAESFTPVDDGGQSWAEPAREMV